MTSYRLRVAEVVAETDDARSFVLDVPPELAQTFAHKPGQFLTVRVPVSPAAVGRCYSLCNAPGDPLTITVKRTADGFGSVWLHGNVAAGDELEVLPPAGRFTPRSLDGSFLLVAGGSGITPVLGILRTVLASGSGRITLFYANRDENSVIFAGELRRLVAKYPDRLTVVHWLESVSGLPTPSALEPLLRPWASAEVFLCGPSAFMAAVDVALRGIGVERVHVERFQSLAEDPFVAVEAVESSVAEGEPLEVEIDGANHTLAWPDGRRMLDVLVEHGLAAPSSCREGRCGACTCRLVEGEVEMVNNEVLDATDLADGYVLACQSMPKTGPFRVTYD
ncbi:ferredoxin--NADP reductase [Cryptosporangium aurantiacum]|uniref:3-ketosteroid 9alpha-monooxygenase subunit B n=1 Tax=Cryptosporangium aurantiacum TaxID=134849 RepID=A0A1M7K622_9ACTN|nr:ferredoxin--NADP reductase [Cryptosporangium aurantiacum]SHM60752.1 3-ketosteroid 9alpha-monooxygenase subunit B [Cryptosporangium aurantiacum]